MEDRTQISQAAIAYLANKKSLWLEAQAMSAFDQILKLQERVKELEQIIENNKKE